MAIGTAEVRRIADAYAEVMHRGDNELADSRIEQKLLQATTAASAAHVHRWIATRIPSGFELSEPLEKLHVALQQGNEVGKTLDQMEQKAYKEALGAVSYVLTVGTLPVWLTSLIAAIVGVFGMSQTAGEAVGRGLIALVLTGSAALCMTVRFLVIAGPKIGEASGEMMLALAAAIAGIGHRAEAIYLGTMAPIFDSILTPEGLRPQAGPIVKLRNLAQVVVWSSILFFTGCAIFFLVGVIHAFTVAFDEQTCQYTNPALCR